MAEANWNNKEYCGASQSFMATEYHSVMQVHQNVPGFGYPYPLMNSFSLNKSSTTETRWTKVLFSYCMINTFQNS